MRFDLDAEYSPSGTKWRSRGRTRRVLNLIAQMPIWGCLVVSALLVVGMVVLLELAYAVLTG